MTAEEPNEIQSGEKTSGISSIRQFDIYRFLALALKEKRRQFVLLGFILLVVIGVLFDALNFPISELFAVAGCGGAVVYIGFLLLLTLPRDIGKYPHLWIAALIWIAIGVFVIMMFIFTRA
jgi:hypothetical protein